MLLVIDTAFDETDRELIEAFASELRSEFDSWFWNEGWGLTRGNSTFAAEDHRCHAGKVKA